MSILLDAVTRSKQDDLNVNLDPVLPPRTQYEKVSRTKHIGLLVLLSMIILLLLVVIVWLSRSQTMVSVPVVASVVESAPKSPNEIIQKNEMQDTESPFAKNGVLLAGKVALPIAVAMPVPARYKAETEPRQSQGRSSVASTLVATDPGSEPIILGANANKKGQALLESLQYQVDLAAKELGLDKLGSAPEDSHPLSQSEIKTQTGTREYQSEGNLLAAFEAALKEVETADQVEAAAVDENVDQMLGMNTGDIPNYGQLPVAMQLQVPEFSINAHVYASEPNKRWLNVDGNELQQGDMIDGKLEIIEIRPGDVVLAIGGTEFKVPAI
ncbi:general secretion pathway protein GspB [Shewanella sp. VB17]|uniref:general secretion pathway protein GspB n=1 Tax=Shewanella sp. VB17 TaxID=2739432 RepID=UPI0015634B56|nr:general secretion pathway protein GspB [Shewanella sp. VB17]NRD72937.1 general secretion pathway protein GspB [Shewanella sp. VB17]